MDSNNPEMRALIAKHRKLGEEMIRIRANREASRKRCRDLSNPKYQGHADPDTRRVYAKMLNGERRMYRYYDDMAGANELLIADVLQRMRGMMTRK